MNTAKRLMVATAGASVVLLGMTGAAKAAVITLDFEGIGDSVAVGNFYASKGITFSSNAIALVSDQAGGTGIFDNNVTPSPSTILVFGNGNAATLNYASGFTTGFSFYYSNPFILTAGSVTVYSGLNGTGAVLADIPLSSTASNLPARSQPFVPVGVAFNGTAESIDFGGSATQIAFDNITFGASVPTGGSTSVPEPSSVLSTFGFGLLGAGYRLKRKLQQKQA